MNKDGKPDSESSDDVKDLISKLFDDLDSIANYVSMGFATSVSEHYDEIAKITGIKIGTVKSKLCRARESLKNKLKGVI